MDLILLLHTIITITILVGTGMFVGIKVPLTPEVKRFVTFTILNVFLPALILNGFLQMSATKELLWDMGAVLLFSLGFHSFALVFSIFLSRFFVKTQQKAREIAFLSTFGNTGFIGIPLCAVLFGAKGAVFAAVFDAGMALILFSVGITLIQGNTTLSLSNLKNVLSMPIFAVLTGMFLTLLNFQPPAILQRFLETLGGVATPLAMVFIGMLVVTIVKQRVSVPYKNIAVPLLLKLMILPFIGMVILPWLAISPDMSPLLLLLMMMPTITTAPVIMGFYRADEKLGGLTTISSSLLSLLTIFVMLYISQFVM